MSDATIKSVHNDNGVFVHMLSNNRRSSSINGVRQANVPLCAQNKNSGPFYLSPLPQQKPASQAILTRVATLSAMVTPS